MTKSVPSVLVSCTPQRGLRPRQIWPSTCAGQIVQAEKVRDRLDVKSCFAKTGRMVSTWSKKGITTTTIGDLLDEYVFSEDETIIPEDAEEEITYLAVGYDGMARQGETVMASDHKGSRLFRVKSNQIVVSHINAVHGSIGFVSEELNGCVITSEYTALDSKGVFHPKVIFCFDRRKFDPNCWCEQAA